MTWKLTIAKSGGPNNGPAFTIANGSAGVLESSAFAVHRNQITLRNEECGAGGTTTVHTNVYSYRLQSKTLTFTTVKNSCSDKVAQTILTSEPWAKTDWRPRSSALISRVLGPQLDQ